MPPSLEASHFGRRRYRNESGRITADSSRSTAETGGALPGNAWADCRVIVGADGKARRIEPGIEPLVDGISAGVVPSGADGVSDEVNSTQKARMKRIAGYGNAIVPQVAAVFVRAFMASAFSVAADPKSEAE